MRQSAAETQRLGKWALSHLLPSALSLEERGLGEILLLEEADQLLTHTCGVSAVWYSSNRPQKQNSPSLFTLSVSDLINCPGMLRIEWQYCGTRTQLPHLAPHSLHLQQRHLQSLFMSYQIRPVLYCCGFSVKLYISYRSLNVLS